MARCALGNLERFQTILLSLAVLNAQIIASNGLFDEIRELQEPLHVTQRTIATERLEFTNRQTMSSGNTLPWTCSQRHQWIILPNNYYPNRLREVACFSGGCFNSHYNCTAQTYGVLVLKMCGHNSCEDHRLPLTVRDRGWRFERIQVTVGCICVAE